jgi:hypothetical protein
MNLDVVTFFERECLDHGSGEANRKAIAPFGNLHVYTPCMIYIIGLYILIISAQMS